MPVRVINGLAELRALEGREVGASGWVEITQERINAFAEGTGDRQWIHVDPERASRESPFGVTIAHGFLTLSLAPALAQDIFRVDGVRFILNYGLNRVRFPSPVRVGMRVRMLAELDSLKDVLGGVQAIFKFTMQAEGDPKPACVAEVVMRLYFDDDPLSAMQRTREKRMGSGKKKKKQLREL